MQQDIIKLVKSIQELMISCKLTMSTAESCSAGRIATILTSNDGSSKYFIGGLVCYQNNIKTSFLNVKEETIDKYDVVSAEVAKEMIEGCCKLFNTDCSISVTGYASKSNNPVIKDGTIFVGFKVKDKQIIKKYMFEYDRLINLQRLEWLVIYDFYNFLKTSLFG